MCEPIPDIPTPEPTLPPYTAAPAQWGAVGETGGPGGSGAPTAQVVTLVGDPGAAGVYVQLLKVGPGARIAPHHHAGDRCATVVQGTWWFGYGERYEASALDRLPVGSVYTEPSGADHFAATGDEPVVVVLTGVGPTNTVYADPADDPRNQD